MRSIAAICIAIVLAAVSAPALITRYLDPEAARAALSSARQDTAEPGEAEEASPAPAPGQVSIRAERDGHFYVEAEVNLRPVRVMVDTGATVVALRFSDAVAAGLRLRPADFQHPVQTANGTAMAAAANIGSIAVQGIEVSGVRALILPDEQLSISLLGGSFLNRLARFEVSDGTLIFEN